MKTEAEQYGLSDADHVIQHGGNQYDTYIVVCTDTYHWRINCRTKRQTFIGPCTCNPHWK